jgi:AcrR family transcriptional regulator
MKRVFQLPPETALATKDKILDAAEELFAEHGFAETSLRRITTLAGVNLAAVNYHFQSKESLILAVLRRRIEPLNRIRIGMLDQLEASYPGNSVPPLESVLRIFFAPIIEAKFVQDRPSKFPQLVGRLFVEPGQWVDRVFRPAIEPMRQRLLPVLCRALPGLSPGEVAFGLHLAVGSLSHLLSAPDLLAMLSNGYEQDPARQGETEKLIRFAAAGMRALRNQEVAPCSVG